MIACYVAYVFHMLGTQVDGTASMELVFESIVQAIEAIRQVPS